ncbi:HAD-IA family hydrolase [Psychrobium sp. MM17-31]|uniref:HAD-IA family hydrolase n=1 Tax=Psychrobium sp. MM17-31 TaxID=2917758 RepID=UPI001EF5D47E|nr:HAD-IA family hydrolase [Psychrobium sp. MM17-31]MCG7532273.1 HAD-IA family hydrolase [Psychrobium sp. MM17-31]
MQFYKDFTRPKAIGFDLDDTLYDNRPVLLAAEAKLHQFLVANHPKTAALTIEDWTRIRLLLAKEQPHLKQDVTLARNKALIQGFIACGYAQEQAKTAANQAMEVFLAARNDITVSESVISTLKLLKQHFRLFVISNGNADITKMGISELFEFAFHPSLNTRPAIAMKPAADMFVAAEKRLGLSGKDILYIGDHPVSDIVGSNDANWQSGWLNVHQRPLSHYKKPQQLPTFEITEFSRLTGLR